MVGMTSTHAATAYPLDLASIRERDARWREAGLLTALDRAWAERRALLAEIDHLRVQVAQAWDEGWSAGDADAYQLSESAQGRAETPIPSTNPYR